ncbi:hypothetical protein [Spiroplasma endosymbiont of 'Nebria riversi']|uniref:hypothetical protein n=1 Tax=Spiroplasma endosymbiont of 'Nebria riversi' TaxID=2792084 RepID=UPI001C05E958|nr:hypothetical protein [Spiroplasma endosymbiont of 'Nebria riversi']
MRKTTRLLWVTFKNDSQLAIKKLVLIANFLAICLLVGYISKFIPPLFLPYLKLEFIDVFIIIAFPFLGIIYTYFLVFLIPWMLMLITSVSGPIAYLALMLATGGFYSIFLIVQIPLFFIIQFCGWTKNSSGKFLTIIVWIISIFLAAIINSFWMTFLNWAFILELYGMASLRNQLFIVFLPFNLIKFCLEALVYSLIVTATWPLIEKNANASYYILL